MKGNLKQVRAEKSRGSKATTWHGTGILSRTSPLKTLFILENTRPAKTSWVLLLHRRQALSPLVQPLQAPSRAGVLTRRCSHGNRQGLAESGNLVGQLRLEKLAAEDNLAVRISLNKI